MTQILWMSREKAEQFQSTEPYAIISLTDPGSEYPNLPYTDPMCKAVIRHQCSDVDSKMIAAIPPAICESLDIRPFTPVMAAEIAQFVQAVWPEVNVWVCHCEAGISRSAGMAAALAYFFGVSQDPMFTKAVPNIHIFRLMVDALIGGRPKS